jgi:hypothetical protein
MVKGGPRHTAKPTTDSGLLLKALKENVGNVVDMGPYETLSRSGGCNPKGLVENADLLKALVMIEPTAEIHPAPLKAAMLKLLTDEPTLNKSKFVGNVWITMRIERITTILYHLRRLANDPDAEKFCATRLTGSEYHAIKHLIWLVEVKDNVLAARAAQKRIHEEEQWETATVAYDETGTPSKKRTLKKEISEVSVDSTGFPKMAQSPAHAPAPKSITPIKRLGSKTNLDLWESAHEQKILRCSLGFENAEQTIPSSSSKSLKKADPLEKGKPPRPPVSQNLWFKLSKTNATKPERSYILGCKQKGDKMKLIVEVPATWSSQYSFIVDKLMMALREDNLTKEQAKDLRSELCKQYP